MPLPMPAEGAASLLDLVLESTNMTISDILAVRQTYCCHQSMERARKEGDWQAALRTANNLIQISKTSPFVRDAVLASAHMVFAVSGSPEHHIDLWLAKQAIKYIEQDVEREHNRERILSRVRAVNGKNRMELLVEAKEVKAEKRQAWQLPTIPEDDETLDGGEKEKGIAMSASGPRDSGVGESEEEEPVSVWEESPKKEALRRVLSKLSRMK